MILNVTFSCASFSAMFFTATLDWATIQAGLPSSSQTAAAAEIVLAFPGLGFVLVCSVKGTWSASSRCSDSENQRSRRNRASVT
ncbi:hypothetical protein B0H14DRAFT_2787439 [Mycena olivaceomarginata]|nr:hypothetical protein B0H14DRAFT_2787439 [Mycena olivaceomarginata]